MPPYGTLRGGDTFIINYGSAHTGEEEFLTMHNARSQDRTVLEERAERIQGYLGIKHGQWIIDGVTVTSKLGFRVPSSSLTYTLARAMTLPGLVKAVFRPQFDFTRISGVNAIFDDLIGRGLGGEPGGVGRQDSPRIEEPDNPDATDNAAANNDTNAAANDANNAAATNANNAAANNAGNAAVNNNAAVPSNNVVPSAGNIAPRANNIGPLAGERAFAQRRERALREAARGALQHVATSAQSPFATVQGPVPGVALTTTPDAWKLVDRGAPATIRNMPANFSVLKLSDVRQLNDDTRVNIIAYVDEVGALQQRNAMFWLLKVFGSETDMVNTEVRLFAHTSARLNAGAPIDIHAESVIVVLNGKIWHSGVSAFDDSTVFILDENRHAHAVELLDKVDPPADENNA
ncbi:hypothetical protein PHSY_003070 [Pseudozyma hubeiensis SY62]|uniref:Uncharacterized protein n=1 Tax=Pseudozyma hubeiensis (strain SY62) TaxID=1305764 RepID=R9P2K3_PSEHS|nr:hypothetical protein PHSY_003070 [Pseudozyma hubeiensis SY62]GAC95494.1 hypothetical protein PHSY_003070 [Pseudozyma hubeiensis SY62]